MIRLGDNKEKEVVNILKSEYDLLLKSSSEVEQLKVQLAELKRMIFGSKSERFVPLAEGQLGLFSEDITEIPVPEEDHIIEVRRKQPSKSKQVPVRTTIPAHLPRVEEIIEPENKTADSEKIGEEITEILEYTPGKLFVRRIIRPKYRIGKEISIGELPSLPLPKSNAGASLLSHIMVSKFIDHLPFYRQIQIFKRQKVVLSSSTISGWFNQTSELLEPLYDVLEQEVLNTHYLQMDESPIGVQDSHKIGALHQGYQWVYRNPVKGLVLFKYDSSRSKKVPEEILSNYSGYLQTDGYAAYQNLVTKGNITLLGCMAHARRYFEKALDNDHKRASYVLKRIQELYIIEKKCKERSVDETVKQRYRNKYANPILKQMKHWLDENIQQVLPKSSIGKAIAYTIKIWKNLERYVLDPRFEIDNNLVENSIRPLALGRKNYLFAGSHKAAQNIAMMYSFFASCKVNQIEPLGWLTHTLENILDHKANKLVELLPHNYNPKK